MGKLFAANHKLKGKKGLAIYAKEKLNPKLILEDDEARMIMVEVQKEQRKFLIINIYAPNEKQEAFFEKLKEETQKLNYQDFLIIGDFKCNFR